MSAPPCVLDTPLYIFASCGKCAHVHGEHDANGAAVTLWEAGEGKHTRWRIERAGARGEGYFNIVSCHSRRAWCNAGGNTEGVGIVTWDQTRGDDSIQVYFEPAEKQGYWYISFRDGHKSAQVLRESEANGAPVATWSREARPHFWWRFEVYTRVCSAAWDLCWQGFGCSLCWWANALDPTTKYAKTYADLLFSLDTTRTLNASGQKWRLQGLGLNVVRYNIGGGDPATHWGQDTPSFKDIKGFWVKPWSDWNPAADPEAWDWDLDKNQREWVRLAKDRAGANFMVQAFSNSPMYWMTASSCTRGAAAAGAENFKPQHAGWHANYLARVAERARTHWGIDFHSLEPFNEPDETWWTMSNCHQEGCRMEPRTQMAVLRELRAAMWRLGLHGVRVTCSDENSHRRALQTWRAFQQDADLVDGIGLVCVHSYEGLQPARDNNARALFRKAVQSRDLWMTEYGDGEGSGADLVTTIVHDLHFLRCRCWCYWQPIEPWSGWGLINVEYGSPGNGAPRWVYHKYWAFATVTRFLRPGMFVLTSSAVDTVFALDIAASQLVILVVNGASAEIAEFDLRAFGAIGPEYTMVCTAFDGSKLLKEMGQYPTQVEARRISVNLPAESIVSLRCYAEGLPPCALGKPMHVETFACPGKVAHLHAEEDADGARVTLWSRSSSDHFLWRVERAGASTFRIVSCRSGRAWCNVGRSTRGTTIVTWDTRSRARDTEVVFQPAEVAGCWYIVFVASKLSAHLFRENILNGAPLATWAVQPRRHHWWRFVPAS